MFIFVLFFLSINFSVKRSQDKEKLKEFEKMKIQLDQLLEFKRAILESQSQLQKELQRWKQEAREAVEAKERHEEETTEMVENFELATLDKEMAEEKVHSFYVCFCHEQMTR